MAAEVDIRTIIIIVDVVSICQPIENSKMCKCLGLYVFLVTLGACFFILSKYGFMLLWLST